MKSYRSAGIPIDHILAEIAAFPIASEASLQLHPTMLDPGFERDSKTPELWRMAENMILSSFPAFSVDEVVSARDRIWFGLAPSDQPATLDQYLRGIADSYLTTNGPVALPHLKDDTRLEGTRETSAAAYARRALRWLTFALPPDLLLASIGNSNEGPERIEMLAPGIHRLLSENGFAETHLHVGASLDYGLLWNSLMHAIVDTNFKISVLCSPGAALNEGVNLAQWVIRCALCRYVLAAFLASERDSLTLLDFLYNKFYRHTIEDLGLSNYSLLLKAFADLEAGQLASSDIEFASLKMLYAKLTRVSAEHFPPHLEEARRADPIASFFYARGSDNRSPEICFVAAALDHMSRLREQKIDDPHFCTSFWQVVRIRNIFYRHIVQRPLTPGLQWFVRFYARAGPAKKRIQVETYLEYARNIEGGRCSPRSIEIRTSPDPNITEILKYTRKIDAISGAWKTKNSHDIPADSGRSSSTELGIIYHFVRDRGGGTRGGRPAAYWSDSYANPQKNPAGYRYSRFYLSDLKPQALSLAWLMRHFPAALEIVRGIDVCADELGVPNWVIIPIFKQLRHTAAAAVNTLRHLYGAFLPSFRTTVHAGEDFVHLLTGLRYVDQAIEQFKLNEGDRIGHGLSLGVDPRDWAIRAGRIPVIAEERLFDLVWEWSWYGKQWCQPDGGRAVYLQREIARLSEQIFGLSIAPLDLERLMQDLCDASMISRVGFPDGYFFGCDLENCDGRRCKEFYGNLCRLWLLYRYLTAVSLFKTGRQVMWIDPFNEADVLVTLQKELRRKVGSLGIVVEVNPTSNLLIGDLGDLAKHPLWRLRPPKNDGEAPPVSICIGSDDPVTFGTSLPEEYQSLCDSMILAGLSEEEARQWLDRTRQTGVESRFTLPRSQRGPIDFILP